jgi:hypothetical protein
MEQQGNVGSKFPKINFEEYEPQKTKIVFDVPGKAGHLKLALPAWALLSSIITVSGWLLWIGKSTALRGQTLESISLLQAETKKEKEKNDECHLRYETYIAKQTEMNEWLKQSIEEQKQTNRRLERLVLGKRE